MSQELLPIKDIVAVKSNMILSHSIEELHETVDKLDRHNKNLNEKLMLLSLVIGFLALAEILPILISFSRVLDLVK